MNIYQKSALIGHYRNGATIEEIAKLFDISEHYATMIIKHYLDEKELEEKSEKVK